MLTALSCAIFRLTNVDVGDGWLIFGLPPAEVAVHPSDKNDVHEFYLMCDCIQALIAAMEKRGITCGPVHNLGWGVLTQVMLPGGGKLGVYQPRHARPTAMRGPKAVKSAARRMAKRPAAKGSNKQISARTSKKARRR